MKIHVDLFSGIGGFSLGLERAGFKTVVFCEQDKFCQKVLNKHWPEIPIEPDIKTFDGKKYAGAFILTGGFPCQPFSCAGKRRGKEDERALWPEMFRVIQEVRPTWIIGENVAGFIGMGLDDSISDLEREGYSVQAFIIPACAVNAPHRRDRVWIVAHSTSGRCFNGCGDREERHFQDSSIRTVEENKSERNRQLNRIKQTDSHAPDTTNTEVENVRKPEICSVQNADASDSEGRESGKQTESEGRENISRGNQQVITDTGNEGLQGRERPGSHGEGQAAHGSITERNNTWDEPWLEVAARLCTLDDGLPNGLPRPRGWRNAALKAVGNAVVPQIPEILGRAIMEIEQ